MPSTPLNFFKNDFSGGMNLFTDSTRLQPNQYALLVNARSRYDRVTPVKLPQQQLGVPTSNPQGIFAAGNFAIAFAGGRAYYRDFNDPNSVNFALLSYDLAMSQTAEQIYLSLVPASTINARREPTGSDASDTVNLLAVTLAKSPVAAVIQDGVSQPWLVLSNGIARLTRTYGQWTDSDREYVPIGKQMLYKDGVLYIVSPDGTQIYRSVTGRPIDFMVVVDTAGNKLPGESDGGAARVSHAVSFDPITCISEVNAPDGGFFVGTRNNCFFVTPNFSTTIYGEPTFTNQNFISGRGPLSQFGVLPDGNNGDTTFVDDLGVTSFNSILQYRNEGKNSPLSLPISKLFDGVTQSTSPVCTTFDNYAVYAVNTIYGPAILWFDILRGAWDSIDLFDDVSAIKQFAVVKTSTERKLLFQCVDGKVFEYGASNTTATAKLYVGDFASSDPEIEQKLGQLKVIVNNITENGTINASLYVDRKIQKTLNKDLTTNYVESNISALPFGDSSSAAVRNILFDFGRSSVGYRVGFFIEWNCGSYIDTIACIAKEENPTSPFREQMIAYKEARNGLGI